MIINELNIFMQELDKMMPQFYIYYNLQIVEVTRFNYLCISFGYIMWKLCSYSHILVSILAGFIIVAVTVCLRAGNDHLLGIFEDDQNLLLIKQRKKITVLKEFEEHANRDENVLKALNQVKDIHVVAENVLGSVSKIYGVSLIIEVLILIANLLVDVFYILVPIITNAPSDSDDDGSNVHSSMRSVISQRNNSTRFISQNFFKNYINENGDMPDEFPIEDQPNLNLSLEPFLDGYFITLLGEAFIHSYFFYKLCCRTTEMVNEAKEPLQILKTVPYTQFSQKVQHQISILKRDLATNTITLTAANYFQINKFTLTSVTSALTTYIVVLLQFSQQEQGKDSTGNSTRTYT
ncbi:uncharacterized protein LOC118434840 [Folsomia candida]|nr:uncharacterized protein LOC118434840 [Folsomia candida]